SYAFPNFEVDGWMKKDAPKRPGRKSELLRRLHDKRASLGRRNADERGQDGVVDLVEDAAHPLHVWRVLNDDGRGMLDADARDEQQHLSPDAKPEREFRIDLRKHGVLRCAKMRCRES